MDRSKETTLDQYYDPRLLFGYMMFVWIARTECKTQTDCHQTQTKTMHTLSQPSPEVSNLASDGETLFFLMQDSGRVTFKRQL